MSVLEVPSRLHQVIELNRAIVVVVALGEFAFHERLQQVGRIKKGMIAYLAPELQPNVTFPAKQ